MTYRQQPFTKYDKKQPGIYTQIIESKPIDYATQFGGVAIPVSVIAPTRAGVEMPTEPIKITRDNRDVVMADYTFGQQWALNRMLDEALQNVSTVYLCPFDGVEKEAKELPPRHAFGKGRKTAVEAWFAKAKDNIDLEAPLFESIQGMRVVLTCDEQEIYIQFYAPDGTECCINETFFQPHVSLAKARGSEGAEVTIQDGVLSSTGTVSSLYRVTPDVTYAAETRELHFRIYAQNTFVAGNTDVMYLIGGCGKYKDLVDITNASLYSNCIPGNYVACDMICKREEGIFSGDLTRCTGDSGQYAYLVRTVGHIGSHCGYYLEITPGTLDGIGTARLMYVDMTANVYPAEPQVIREESFPIDSTTCIRNVFGYFPDEIVLIVWTDIEEESCILNAWEVPIYDKDPICIGFSPIFKREAEETRFTKFLTAASKTANPVDVLYYPYWSDMVEGTDFEDYKAKYREIQGWYLNQRDRLCPLTQLLMDESLSQYTREIIPQQPEAMTRNNPYLISLASGLGKKTDSQRIGAYTAGLLSSCGAYRTANASQYTGSANLKLYPQAAIEKMFEMGVLTYHDQNRNKIIYIDLSAYVYGTYIPNNADYINQKTKFPKAYERNKTVRAVHQFMHDVHNMFYLNYFSKTIDGDIAQLLKHDILNIIKTMQGMGAFKQPNPDDVTVTELEDMDGHYAATVGLRMVKTPEILYLTVGV